MDQQNYTSESKRSLHNRYDLDNVATLKQLLKTWKGCLLFVDFAKAFDTVRHDFLLRNLKLCGMCNAWTKQIAKLLHIHKNI